MTSCANNMTRGKHFKSRDNNGQVVTRGRDEHSHLLSLWIVKKDYIALAFDCLKCFISKLFKLLFLV